MDPKTRLLVFQIPKNTKHISVPEVIDQSSTQDAMGDHLPKLLAAKTGPVSPPRPSPQSTVMDGDTRILANGVQMTYREFSAELEGLLSEIKAKAHKEIVVVAKE